MSFVPTCDVVCPYMWCCLSLHVMLFVPTCDIVCPYMWCHLSLHVMLFVPTCDVVCPYMWCCLLLFQELVDDAHLFVGGASRFDVKQGELGRSPHVHPPPDRVIGHTVYVVFAKFNFYRFWSTTTNMTTAYWKHQSISTYTDVVFEQTVASVLL